MLSQWIIEKKRDGEELSEDEIRTLVSGFSEGSVPDYQMSAFAMAVFFKGMTPGETTILTESMMHSGDLINTSSIKLPTADKHSTGGIGDKVSLVLAPLVACHDVAVPMISGRGLGITGGTLDKLESIPGYRANLSTQEFLSVIDKCGCSITGQTTNLVPADKKLYALRDVTGTVPSIPLIAASIMSKKLAEGAQSLVLDIKCGSGAFMKTKSNARKLARLMMEIGRNMDRRMCSLLTDMNQPLGRTAGNALEVLESVKTLQGNGPADLTEITIELASRMLLLSKVAQTAGEASGKLRKTLASGKAFEKFKEMVRLQAGDTKVLDDPSLLQPAEIKEEFPASESGWLAKTDAETIGRAVLSLGAGRKTVNDNIDHAVGISNIAKAGEQVEKGQPLAVVHANSRASCSEATRYLEKGFSVSNRPITPPPVLIDVIS